MIHPIEKVRFWLHRRRLARRHPGWCDRARYHDKQNDREWGRQIHGASIAAGWLYDVHGSEHEQLMPWRGEWMIRVQRDEWSTYGPVVQLELGTGGSGRINLDLQRGEAREIAAGLIAAADRLADQTQAWPS